MGSPMMTPGPSAMTPGPSPLMSDASSNVVSGVALLMGFAVYFLF